jgi:hypothetical protein
MFPELETSRIAKAPVPIAFLPGNRSATGAVLEKGRKRMGVADVLKQQKPPRHAPPGG